ncbi:YceK/YidQ family lipoprotein [Desulfonema magnum]|uniref:YceK/YidQ family lipoprotein n=1 Tax=Desulfonema magnum TaxID=45655 RepID=UPI001A9A744C|nr:YceK/YidQ family lipoprotein [Desulfonema magnum]
MSKTPPFYTTGIYAGTRVDVGIISSGGEGLVFLLDLPFSVVADTIMLPKDIYDKQN